MKRRIFRALRHSTPGDLFGALFVTIGLPAFLLFLSAIFGV